MTSILLNYYNFDEEWARPVRKYVEGKTVSVFPLSFRDSQAWDDASWQVLFGVGGEKYDAVTRPLENLGAGKILWINYFTDDAVSAREKIAASDVLLFTGGLPEKATFRLKKMGLTEDLLNFGGTVIGVSAGAMFQLERYHVTPDDDYPHFFMDCGVGLFSGVDLEVHFTSSDVQKKCIAAAKKLHGLPIYAMYHQGGLLVEGGKVTPLGSVEIF